MKILYVTTISNTVNAFLIPHIKMLIDNGHKVDVAFNIEQDVKEEIYTMGCNIYDVDFKRSPFKNNYKALVNQIKNIVLKGNYDLVHTHTPIASAIVRFACRNLDNVKVIYTAHGFHFYDGAPIKNWIVFYPIEKILSQYTDILITINEEDYKRANSFKARQVVYIPGVGIDLKSIQVNEKKILMIKKELGIVPNNFILCSIGELNQNKNHQIVLEALHKINNKNIKYLIVGTGYLKEKLLQKAKEFNLENQVIFLGFRNDIYEILKVSDVFIFPSHREGLSRSLMEAMAMGKPVIASNIRGNRDLINDNSGGLLFNPTDANELSEYITEMYNNEMFRQTTSAHNLEKIKHFSIEKVLNEVSRIYSNS